MNTHRGMSGQRGYQGHGTGPGRGDSAPAHDPCGHRLYLTAATPAAVHEAVDGPCPAGRPRSAARSRCGRLQAAGGRRLDAQDHERHRASTIVFSNAVLGSGPTDEPPRDRRPPTPRATTSAPPRVLRAFAPPVRDNGRLWSWPGAGYVLPGVQAARPLRRQTRGRAWTSSRGVAGRRQGRHRRAGARGPASSTSLSKIGR